MGLQIIAAVAVFTGVIVLLSTVILVARSRLVETGSVTLVVNEDREFVVPAGSKLLEALADVGLYLPSGCGGKGTCGQCRVRVPAAEGRFRY